MVVPKLGLIVIIASVGQVPDLPSPKFSILWALFGIFHAPLRQN